MSDDRKEFFVEACRREDLAQVRAILEGAPEAAAWSEEALERALKDAPDEFLVARRGSEVAGFVLGRRMGEESEILNLAVRREFRRTGIGRHLVAAILASYEERRCAKTFLEVRQSNRGAIAFYEKLGFRQVGRREGYYREPVEAALVLVRGK